MRPIIVIYIWCRAEAHFFIRFQKAADKMGYCIFYITDKYSAYQYLAKKLIRDNKVFFIKESKIISFPADFSIDIERRLKTFSDAQIQEIYDATLSFLDMFNDKPISCIFMWNGYRVIDHALQVYAYEKNIKTLYFEIANIPGKIFVDPQGTNARSLLQKKPEVLQDFLINFDDYLNWKREYIMEKMVQRTVKQAKHTPLGIAAKDYLWDIWGRLFKNGGCAIEYPFRRLYRRFFKSHINMCNSNSIHGAYILFPLQVSNDTQVVLNANCSLLEAVRRSVKLARNQNVYLVIKPHPAEKNPTYVKQLLEVTSTYDKVIFSNENTFKLMKNALEVVTINSTVGLEALILGCNVHIIGKAFYENFHTEDDIARYIMGYLLDVDYWGEKPLSTDILNKMLERAHLS